MTTAIEQSTSNLDAWLKPMPQLQGLTLMDHLFNRLDGMYPNKWRASFPNAQAVDNWRQAWADGFAEEAISINEIRQGLSACRRLYDWPPSLPEFLKACRQPIDAESAYREAVEQIERRRLSKDQWTHPAIFWAAMKIGEFDLKQSSWQTIKVRWSAALTAQLAKHEWPEIPAYAAQLPAPGKTTTTAEEARERIEKLLEEQRARENKWREGQKVE